MNYGETRVETSTDCLQAPSEPGGAGDCSGGALAPSSGGLLDPIQYDEIRMYMVNHKPNPERGFWMARFECIPVPGAPDYRDMCFYYRKCTWWQWLVYRVKCWFLIRNYFREKDVDDTEDTDQ